MFGERIGIAMKVLLTGRNPLQDRLTDVEARNLELKNILSERTEALNKKLEITRQQVQAKEDAIDILNKRVEDLKVKLDAARVMVKNKDNIIRKLNNEL